MKAKNPRKKRIECFDIVNYILMTVFLMICLYPIFFTIARSMSSGVAINNGDVFLWPVGFNLDSYIGIMDHPNFLRSYINTSIYTVLGTLFTLIITALVAYPLSKLWLTCRKAFMIPFIITMFFAGGLIPNFILISRLGLLNSLWAIVLPISFNHFFIILAMGAMQAIPTALEEAAAIDGLNSWQILFYIILPLSKPVFITIGLFTALNIWNEWFTPMIYLHSNDKLPIMLVLRNIITGGDVTTANFATVTGPNVNVNSASLKSAAIILAMLPIAVIFPFAQKFFAKGAVVGSLKG